MFFLVFFFVFFSVFLVLILYVLNFFLSSKFPSVDKVTPFESGFLSVGKVQSSFSLHFFVLMLMFVVFDVEVVMLFGLLFSDSSSFILFFFVFLFVFFGLYLEWFLGNLLWLY